MSLAAWVFGRLPFGPSVKKHLKFAYFRAAAMFGAPASPALFNLDRCLARYLPERGGVFIEAGANDGISQSNTWYFERYQGWSGLLVEPVPALAAMANRFRRAPVANVALGRSDGGMLTLSESDLTTSAVASRANQGGVNISVPVRSLSSLLDEFGIETVDLLSLDVEGFEAEVLAGLDLSRHRPRFMLVETQDPDELLSLLEGRYRLEAKLTFHDYLLKAL